MNLDAHLNTAIRSIARAARDLDAAPARQADLARDQLRRATDAIHRTQDPRPHAYSDCLYATQRVATALEYVNHPAFHDHHTKHAVSASLHEALQALLNAQVYLNEPPPFEPTN
uniref:Uncharacterized protein n=1 Tax=Schlesneria paludicola TaxID=360056 RepID=A0A7C2K016_9PLAN